MTATNQFLPWATGAGANALSQAAFAALTSLIGQGFQDGVAEAPPFNSLMRQVSTASSMIGKFIVDYAALDARDNGDVSELETRFVAALRACVAIPENGLVHFGMDTGGSANSYVVDVGPNITSYQAGDTIIFVPAHDSDGASTLNADANGAVALKRSDGSTALGLGDIAAGKLAIAVHDGTRFRLVFSAAQISDASLWHEGSATGGTATAMTTTLAPAPTSAVAGLKFRCPVTTTNGPNATMNFGFGAKYVVLNETGVAVAGGEMPGGVDFEADLEYDGTNLRLLNPFRSVGGVNGSTSNLLIKNSGGSPDTVLNLTADELVLTNAAGTRMRLQAVALSCNSATTGAGGIDTGTVTNSRLYDLYVCGNPTSGAATLIAVLEGNAPVLPAGYVLSKWVGFQRTDSSGKWHRIRQVGRKWWYEVVPGSPTTGMPQIVSGALGDVTVPTWVSVSLSGIIPSRSRAVDLLPNCTSSSNNLICVAPSPNRGNAWNYSNPPAAGLSAQGGMTPWQLWLETTLTLWACSQSNGLLSVTGGVLQD